MAVVDPNNSSFPSCKTGKKVLACVGFDKRPTKKGDEMQYEVHWVCVKDLSADDGKGDKGADHWDRFTLRDNLLFILGQVMKAAGHTTPFDTEDAPLIADVLSNCYLTVTIVEKEHNGEPVYNTARNGWAPYAGAEEADWAEIIAKATEGHEKIRENRKKKANGGGQSSGTPGARRSAPSDGVPGSEGGGSEDNDPIY